MRLLLALFLAVPGWAAPMGKAPVRTGPVLGTGSVAPVVQPLSAPALGQRQLLPGSAALAAPGGAAALAPAAPKLEQNATSASAEAAPTAAAAPVLEAAAAPASPSAEAAPPSEAQTQQAAAEASTRFDGTAAATAKPLTIVLAGAESVPYVKTGGLADVMDALHRGFARKGHHSVMFLPKYPTLKGAETLEKVDGSIAIQMGDRVEQATLWKATRDGAEVYFIDNANVYSDKGPYASKGHYDDTDDRFIFFSRAVLEAVKFLDLSPDVMHVHDWHVGLIPALLKDAFAGDPHFKNTVAVQTIHNIAYQGVFPFESLLKTGLKPEDFHPEKYEYWGKFNLLKAGLVTSDAITTVSPTYARQIQETEEFGMGMSGLLAARTADVHGIINGIDGKLWNPKTDQGIAVQYDAETAWVGKLQNKTALQKAAGLPVDPNVPVFAVASRFDRQKGVDLVAQATEMIVRLGAQMVFTGSGDPALEAEIKALQAKYPDNVFLHPFSETFVHLVYAGADFLLMPSRFEPCGLSQLIAQLYGTLPVATRTGGLADTIKDAFEHPGDGDGLFIREFSVDALKDAIARSVALFHNGAELDKVRDTAMKRNRSWEPSLDAYLKLFADLLARKPGARD